MLPKKNRVTKELFQTIMKEGKVLSGPFLLFRYIPAQVRPVQNINFAFVVPKAVAKKAVIRNKHRRKGYRILQETPIKQGSGVFFYKKPAILATSIELKEEVISLLKKSKFL